MNNTINEITTYYDFILIKYINNSSKSKQEMYQII